MSVLPCPKRIVGYSDEWSVAPGEQVSFFVGGRAGRSYTAVVHRLLGGGSDPRAPRLRSEPVADLGSRGLLDQVIVPGSYGTADLSPEAAGVLSRAGSVVITVSPWLEGEERTALTLLDGDRREVLRIGIDAGGRVVADVGPDRVVGEVAPLRAFTDVVVSWDDATLTVATAERGHAWHDRSAPLSASPTGGTSVLLGAGLDATGRRCRHFGGRVERPALLDGAHLASEAKAIVGETGTAEHPAVVAAWDLSRSIDTWSIPGSGNAAGALTLHNAPRRAVVGSTWTGATDWREAPEQFGALHLYPDSLEDCDWSSQVSWEVPDGTRSGFYALHVESDGNEDWIPFFVRPPAGTRTADVLVLASSATYLAYGNSRFWWEDPIQELTQDRLVELGPEEQWLVEHPEVGLSNYDMHLDGSPVVFSSRRRPNLSLRPGHGRAEGYASDLYLIAWLERLGIPYDVVTDEDLHFAGADLLDGYPVLLSGSHPEYVSERIYDALAAWVDAGGRLMYMGGNGWVSTVTWGAERPWLMENRATGSGRGAEVDEQAERLHQLDGTRGSDLAASGRPAGPLFGVDAVAMGFDHCYPVLRTAQSDVPEVAFAFEGVESRVIGGRSLAGAGVIGQEWDNARHVAGTPGHYVLATMSEASLVPRHILGPPEAGASVHADVTVLFRGAGASFAVSSMAWVGALHVDDYGSDAERLCRNVLLRFLDPRALDGPPAPTAAG